MNCVIIAGNLCADPDLRQAGSSQVLKLRVATNERYKKGNEWVESTEYHTVTVWGLRAAALAQILSKGQSVIVRGSLKTRSWDKEGQKHYSTEINADDVELTGRKSDGGGGSGAGRRPAERAPEPDIDTPEDLLPF